MGGSGCYHLLRLSCTRRLAAVCLSDMLGDVLRDSPQNGLRPAGAATYGHRWDPGDPGEMSEKHMFVERQARNMIRCPSALCGGETLCLECRQSRVYEGTARARRGCHCHWPLSSTSTATPLSLSHPASLPPLSLFLFSFDTYHGRPQRPRGL